MAYEVPSAAAGDSGVEGFAVVTAGGRAGRVAALNETPDGLVLVVDTGDAYRALAARHVRELDAGAGLLRLTEEGEAALRDASAVEPLVRREDTPRLVRHIPGELARLRVVGESAPSTRSRLWIVGGTAVMLGGIGAMVGAWPAAAGVGGPLLRWAWPAAPGLVLLAGVAVLWRALDADAPTRRTPRDKAWAVLAFVFGITPPTRRRG